MAGSSTSSVGHGANYQCLPTAPVYGNFNTTENDARSAISVATIKDDTNVIDSALDSQVLQCSYCQTLSAFVVRMLVGTKSCPTGWTAEYTGYLISSKEESSRCSMGYACLASSPNTLANSDTTGTSEVYLVEQECGALPCGTYTNYEEVACTVCSY